MTTCGAPNDLNSYLCLRQPHPPEEPHAHGGMTWFDSSNPKSPSFVSHCHRLRSFFGLDTPGAAICAVCSRAVQAHADRDCTVDAARLRGYCPLCGFHRDAHRHKLDPHMVQFLADHPLARSQVYAMMKNAATTCDDAKMVEWYKPVAEAATDEDKKAAWEKLTK